MRILAPSLAVQTTTIAMRKKQPNRAHTTQATPLRKRSAIKPAIIAPQIRIRSAAAPVLTRCRSVVAANIPFRAPQELTNTLILSAPFRQAIPPVAVVMTSPVIKIMVAITTTAIITLTLPAYQVRVIQAIPSAATTPPPVAILPKPAALLQKLVTATAEASLAILTAMTAPIGIIMPRGTPQQNALIRWQKPVEATA